MRLSLLVLLASVVGCSSAPSTRPPMGALPTAVTSAEPLWIPFRVHAGASVERDPREVHFDELRRLTTGGKGGSPTWAADGRRLSYVAPDDCRVYVTVELETGRTKRSELPNALESLVAPDGLLDAECPLATTTETRSSAAALPSDDPTAFRPPTPLALGGITNPRWRPTLSPDHAWVAWQAPRPGANDGALDVFVATASGARPRSITRDGLTNINPTFTYDGRRVLFASDRDATSRGGALALYLVAPDGPVTASGGPVIERIGWGSGSERAPRFSPDGRWLAFLSSRGGGGFDVYVARWRD
jgi:hypothetical protein